MKTWFEKKQTEKALKFAKEHQQSSLCHGCLLSTPR